MLSLILLHLIQFHLQYYINTDDKNIILGFSICKRVYLDKQQGPTVQHRKLYSISCDKL